jgi:hypothetical protein
MIAIFALIAFFAGVSVLAFLILSYVRSFRLTSVNFLLFVIGAAIGMLALTNLYVGVGTWLVRVLRIHASEKAGWVGLPLVLAGSALGGSGLVWLKMRFAKPQTK